MNVKGPEHGRITRKQFIRRAGAGAAAIGATAAGLGGVAHAAPVTRDVYPTGTYPSDKIAIQNAIDAANAGDVILLHATATPGGSDFTPFNLGTIPSYPPICAPFPATITITKALTIRGEQLTGLPKTRINGGYGTFFVYTLVPGEEPTGTVDFDLIDSHGASFYFIFYAATNGGNVNKVNIYDGHSVNPGGNPHYALSGLFTGIRSGVPSNLPFPLQYNTAGQINISCCRFDNSNIAGLDGYGNAIMMLTPNTTASASEAYLSVSECYFKDFAGRAIETYKWDEVTLLHNIMESSVAGSLLISAQDYGNGRTCTAVWVENADGKKTIVDIRNNTINISLKKYTDFNVSLGPVNLPHVHSGSRIEGNTIYANIGDNKYTTLFNPVFGFNDAEDFTLSGNTVSGQLQFGILLGDCKGGNVLGNDLTGLTASYEQLVILGGTDNRIVPDASGVMNRFGPVAVPGYPAVYCNSDKNIISHNDFTQTGLKGFNVSGSGIARAGCVFLHYGTTGNVVEANISDNPAYMEFPQMDYKWYDACTQIADGSLFYAIPQPPPPEPQIKPNEVRIYLVGTNGNVPYACDSSQYEQMIDMLNKYADWYGKKY